MKRIFKFFGTAIVLLLLSTNSFAQLTNFDVANAHAVIVTPILIDQEQDLDFGNLAVNLVEGHCYMDVAGTRTVDGSVQLVPGGTPQEAQFTITGVEDAIFEITITPALLVITNSNSNTMDVDSWVTNPVSPAPLTNGTLTLHIGATLHVDASQDPGQYNSLTPFTVTVNYQ